jgi:hypothetical protein
MWLIFHCRLSIIFTEMIKQAWEVGKKYYVLFFNICCLHYVGFVSYKEMLKIIQCSG